MAHECLVVLSSCSWTKWPRMHYCNCRMLSYERLRREYCKCGLFEGSARRARGPDVCLREVGGDFRAARGHSRHASRGAPSEWEQNSGATFAGSAQMSTQAGSSRAPPMDEAPMERPSACPRGQAPLMNEVPTGTCLHMREVECGSRCARGQSGHAGTMAPAACCAVSAQHTVQAKWWWAVPA